MALPEGTDTASTFDSAAFLKTVTERAGVYRMMSAGGDILYVGKASNLKNRLSSYFQKNLDSKKTQTLVAQIHSVQTTVTNNNAEALLLECNLIKEHRPRYNVVLRDDKSYPFIFISTEDDYPRLAYQRGARRRKGKYIGPFPSAGAVKRSMGLVQKLFKVRQCEDSYYRNRSRPCLQHQIKRCTAPCVGKISAEDYRNDVDMTVKVLELDFEGAAKYRDQIGSLKAVSDMGNALQEGNGDVDYVAVAVGGGQCCVQVFYIRNGMNLGNKAFYPATPGDSTSSEILNAFITQFYMDHELPKEIIISEAIEDEALLKKVFSDKAGHNIAIAHSVRGDRAKMQGLAATNADVALQARLASRSGMAKRLDAVRELVGLEEAPSRMECFDISHTMGEETVASCVVFNAEGPNTNEYRRFNIDGITPGDDYAAMKQAITRRYSRLLKEGRDLPDILFIDGGKGQVSMAQEVMRDLQITDMEIVGVSKGPDRRPGDETLLLCSQNREVQMRGDSAALLLVQQIRDEAHRFAITGHRGKRGKKRQKSVLEEIKGLGPKRRKQLLTHFGGLQHLQKAGVEDIAAVPGFSEALANKVYDELHPTQGLTPKS